MIDFEIDPMIRKHTLIVQRLRNIKEMRQILNGESITYKRYMNDTVFLKSVKHNLNIEEDLLNDLLTM
jgi:hypothetical protein